MFFTANAKYVEGHLRTTENWAFLSRFCFLSQHGQFEYTIEYNKEFSVQNLLLYYDDDNHWPQVYKSNKTCEEKESVLSIRHNQIVNLTVTRLTSGCRLINRTQTIYCNNSKRFHSARERWWFLAISNCNTTKGLSLNYKFLMTNGPPGDYWHHQFSADEFYILPALIGFFVLYMLLIFAVVMCTIELKSRQLLHSTYKLFVASIVLQELGILTQCIAYIKYAINGIGLEKTKDLGRICESASEIIFVLVLLLLAKGYTVTRGRLPLGSSVKLTVFMCLYVVFFSCLFLYEKEYFDPGTVLYTYESFAGYGLIGLRIIAWWMFIYATIFTLKHYPEKSSFYYNFILIGTLWFITGPVFILCANTFIDKWVRESVVCAVQHFITATGHILFLMLTVPNKANANFPYHVRTTQIGVMEVTDGTLGANTLDYFGHHPYAPGGLPLQKSLNRNYRHWDYNHTEIISHNRSSLNTLPENNKRLPLPQESVPAISNGCNTDYLIARPEDIPRVPDFTAPSHKQIICSQNLHRQEVHIE